MHQAIFKQLFIEADEAVGDELHEPFATFVACRSRAGGCRPGPDMQNAPPRRGAVIALHRAPAERDCSEQSWPAMV